MANESPTKSTYGLVAEFTDTPEFVHAAEKCRDEGFSQWDCFTPLPVHGLDAAMGLKRSKVPLFTFIGGVTGFTLGCLITWYMNAYDYPLIVGGKPYWSPIFPFPVMYELTILLAAFGTLGGMFTMNLLPRHHHPIFDYDNFPKCGDDTYFIVVESSDPKFDPAKTRAFLEGLGALKVSQVEASI
ncbi:MAG: DUF3341 domain-containing protein [Opitutales bacterium]